MATPNYNYEKRQRELAKKKKKEEKLKEREARKNQPGGPDAQGVSDDEDTAEPGQAPPTP
jgi:hypothetical protein